MPLRIISDTDNSFKVLFDYNPQPMWIVDIKTLKFVAVNDAAVERYGYTRVEFLKAKLSQIRPQYEHTAMLDLIHKIKDKQTVKETLTHIKKNGAPMFVNITSYTVNYQGSKCRMVIINDITAEKLKNEKLKIVWAKLRQTLEKMTDGFIMINMNLQLTYINNEAQKILCIKKKTFLNKSIMDVLPEIADTEIHLSILNTMSTSKTCKVEQYLPDLQKWISFTIYPDPSGVALYFTNATAEKNSQLLNKNYIKKLEDLAYLNSHVIRREVANIAGISHLLEHEVNDKEQLSQTIKMLSLSVKNLDDILRNINSKIEK